MPFVALLEFALPLEFTFRKFVELPGSGDRSHQLTARFTERSLYHSAWKCFVPPPVRIHNSFQEFDFPFAKAHPFLHHIRRNAEHLPAYFDLRNETVYSGNSTVEVVSAKLRFMLIPRVDGIAALCHLIHGCRAVR